MDENRLLPDFEHLSIVAIYALLFVSTIIALWKGGAPERWGAAVLLTMCIAQLSLYSFADPRFDSVDWVAVIADLIGLIGFTAIALKANRFWPIFAAALQGISCLAHLARYVEPDFLGLTYVWLKAAPTTTATLLLLITTLVHRWRLSVQGHDRSWTEVVSQ